MEFKLPRQISKTTLNHKEYVTNIRMVEQYIYLHVSICEGEWDLDKYGSECDCLFVYRRGCLCSSFIFFVFFIIVLELLSLYPPPLP